MAERVQVRELMPVEGNKLLGVIRRGSGSVVRWRRAQIVLWSAQATRFGVSMLGWFDKQLEGDRVIT